MFTADRTALRRTFVESWRKYRAGQPLEPLERLIAETVAQHPEYHPRLEARETLEQEFTPEAGRTNPFLHMAMHLTLREQLAADRPGGIAALYRRMLQRCGDPHGVEHQLMECLGEALWEAQRNRTLPDERAYLDCVRRLAKKPR